MKKILKSKTGKVFIIIYLLFTFIIVVMSTGFGCTGFCGLLLPLPVLPFYILFYSVGGVVGAIVYLVAVVVISAALYFVGAGIGKLFNKFISKNKSKQEQQF